MIKLMNRRLAAKLISVFFAMILWLFVMSEINPSITREELNVPVQLVNETILQQAGLVVFGNPEPTVRVRLSGNRDQVQRISRNNIEARLDLRGYQEGSNSIPIEVTVPGGVEVDWTPKFATIELERIVSKQKEVVVNIEGQTATGYMLGIPELRPSQVWIEGPESFVNSVEMVTADLTLENQRDNISLSLPLRAVNSRGEEVAEVNVRTTLVDLFVAIDQLKSVPVELNIDVEAEEGYQVVSLISDPVDVTIRGQESILSNITQVTTEAFRLEELNESTEVEIPLSLPSGVQAHDRQSITVWIEVEPMIDETYVIPRESYRIMNLSQDLILDQESLPERLEITINTLASIAETLDPRTIFVFIDLEDLEEGVHEIIPLVQLPAHVESSVNETIIDPEVFMVELIPRD